MTLVSEEDIRELGMCCICGIVNDSVRNLICLDLRAPKSGTGWGCALCQLPADGAVSVICDGCLEAHGENLLNSIKSVVFGYAVDKGRCSISCVLDHPFYRNEALHILEQQIEE